MTNKVEHTPTPWECRDKERYLGAHYGGFNIVANGEMIFSVSASSGAKRAANKDFLFRAVNNHETLLEACRVLLNPRYTGGRCPWCGGLPKDDNDILGMDIAHASNCPTPHVYDILAQVEGKEA